MTIPFVGRQNELDELKRFFKKKVASLIVVKGRRRIGKSRLIEKFCENHKHYLFTGLVPTANTTKQSQLSEFANQRCIKINILKIPHYKAINIKDK